MMKKRGDGKPIGKCAYHCSFRKSPDIANPVRTVLFLKISGNNKNDGHQNEKPCRKGFIFPELVSFLLFIHSVMIKFEYIDREFLRLFYQNNENFVLHLHHIFSVGMFSELSTYKIIRYDQQHIKKQSIFFQNRYG